MTLLIPPVLAQTEVPTVTLEPAGLVVMILSIVLVCGLTIFCTVRILSDKAPEEHLHAPLDIDTQDADK